ncbi:MAG TPA: dTMP kinase [Nitrospirae bacterium]|nr:thymidylate kinase [bacterium BMS3Abin06]HDH10631.1 dTMP kinase [Nitrospirota bacterium]
MSGAKGFISFEGIEGSGKSTQTKLLAGYLRAKGYSVVETAEPGGTKIGNKIRGLLLEPQNHMDPLAELLLYYSSRAQHIREVIHPAILRNDIVITDRFTDSTVAYQGYARGIALTIINTLNEIVAPDMKPCLTLLLDLDVEEGLRRNRHAQKEDRFELETIEFHNRVRKGFLKIAEEEPERIKVLDASRSAEEINREVVEIINKSLPGIIKISPGSQKSGVRNQNEKN